MTKEMVVVLVDEKFVTDQDIYTFDITIKGTAMGRMCSGMIQTNCTPPKEDTPTGVPSSVATPIPSVSGECGYCRFSPVQ
jgi:hypothetical protein